MLRLCRLSFSTLKPTSPSPAKSSNAALLDAFNELIGTAPKGLVSTNTSNGLTVAKGSSSSRTSLGSVELAPEFNLTRAEAEVLKQTAEGQRLTNQARFRYNPPTSMIYQASELLEPINRSDANPTLTAPAQNGMASPFADPNLEVRRSVDIFRRNKYDVSHVHKVRSNHLF